jgi:hypothetical protein
VSALLERLRAYAAANPTDVAVVAETVRQGAEIAAYEALAELSGRWRRRQDAECRRARAEAKSTVHALLVRTLRGVQAPTLDHEPFPLVNRWPLKPASVRSITQRGD